MLLDRSTMTRVPLSNFVSSLTIGIVLTLLFRGSLEQDIVFPKDDDAPRVYIHRTTSTQPPSTTPVMTSGNDCPENMILVEETETSSFCECLEGYLYYRKHDKCYRQYTRGPCTARSNFIVRSGDLMASCVQNPCQRDDEVMYKGSCHGLLVPGGPCKANETLLIPDTGYEPACASIETVNYQLITAPKKRCTPGTRRAADGLCRTKL